MPEPLADRGCPGKLDLGGGYLTLGGTAITASSPEQVERSGLVTVADQTRACLARVEALLERAGSSREKMLQAIVWLADINDFAEMNAVWDAWVPAGCAPARACGEAKLARADLKVEIIVTAACD